MRVSLRPGRSRFVAVSMGGIIMANFLGGAACAVFLALVPLPSAALAEANAPVALALASIPSILPETPGGH